MVTDSLFTQWGLSEETLHSISALGFENPTPVQAAVIPHLLTQDSDLLALAKTGTGKTAAFGIPLVEKLSTKPELQALVLCPTRELATQVAQNLQAIGKGKGLKVTTVLGGESYRKQIDSLSRNPQILVSTPGRLIDLMEQKIVKLETVRTLILDEADEMLSFGFQEALETIWDSLQGKTVHTWLFSATMSESIKRLTSKYLNSPHQVTLNSAAEPTKVKSYAAVVYEEDKIDALCLLLKNTPEFYGIIFAQTKKQVGELEIKLRSLGNQVDSLHGDKVQADRTRVITRMKRKETQILVATDVAARGLDIENLTHVVNFEIPWDVETFTHRIGRTARAGKEGIVWTMVRPKEAHQLRKFERHLKFQFEPLQIPSVMDVRKNQIKAWLKAVAQTEVSSKDLELYKNIILDLQVEEEFLLSNAAQEWIFKAMAHSQVGADFEGHQPRSFDLRPREDSAGSRAFGGGGSRPSSRSGSSRPSLRGSDRGRPSRAAAAGDRPSRAPSTRPSRASADDGDLRQSENSAPARRPRNDKYESLSPKRSARSEESAAPLHETAPEKRRTIRRSEEDRPRKSGFASLASSRSSSRGSRTEARSDRSEGRSSVRDRFPRRTRD